MGTRIKGVRDYQLAFSDAEKRKRAYDLAWENRKFEIELYWKRATYFWTLIAATFAGYFALAAKPQHSNLLFLAACIGLVLSASWYLVNRGSKYWQENWERHVDSLEDEFAGPLYKTVISKEQFRLWKFWDGYPFSVSKVNQLTSLFVVLIWVGLAVVSFPRRLPLASLISAEPYFLVALTVLFIVLLMCLGGSGFEARTVDFWQDDLAFSSSGEEGVAGRTAMEIRGRLKDLNTKAYYLLVALSFIYRTSPTRSLRCAFTLTAIVAVLPVQDYIKSARVLEFVRIMKVLCLASALVFTLWWVWFQ